ncbi:NAD(P)-dependent oxidoreductase [Pseudomonas oryzihabitans]|uniref:NAD-dependent epimerase/dehydratase family protein n=1 Tax=Pseudomonas oryzihabitans TaxID=47885 RepID=UPI002895C629|nr:NAD(P)-dependent oxidoreductase [Pseudomonas oryzihabitans]MDT3719870.1 NAD(P)-dependent oxidoreductase [Pseudomonas oryzihabitans]
MHVLLTGATGFFGSHLVRRFQADGHRVSVLVRGDLAGSRLAGSRAALEVLDAQAALAPQVAAAGPDVVVHAATCYGRRGEGDQELLQVNVQWALELLLACGAARVPVFVNLDTSLPHGINAYALSKHHFRDWLRLRCATAAPRVLNIRLESLYGPGDDASKFATGLIRALLAGRPDFPLTAGLQRRDFIHVEDAVVAFGLLLEDFLGHTAVFREAAVGTGQAVTIREFAETAKRLSDSATRLAFGALPYRPQELMCTAADTTELQRLGWAGARDLATGLAQTIDQERRNHPCDY